MKLVDLTHIMRTDMPVYPGTEPPIFKTGCSIEVDGFLEKEITMFSHTGTHIDAPAHLIKEAKTLDQLELNHFYGAALLIDLESSEKSQIEHHDLEPYLEKITKVDFLILKTGWSRYWGTEAYFKDYPVLTLKAATWLSKFNLKGVGLDTISIDNADVKALVIHKIILEKNIIIIENLNNLADIKSPDFMFSCLPLRIEQADGSPVRAVAYVE